MVKRPWLASRFRKPCNGTMAGPFLAACNHCGRAGPFRVRGPERRAGIDKEVSFSFTFFPGQRFRASRHGLVLSGWGLVVVSFVDQIFVKAFSLLTYSGLGIPFMTRLRMLVRPFMRAHFHPASSAQKTSAAGSGIKIHLLHSHMRPPARLMLKFRPETNGFRGMG